LVLLILNDHAKSENAVCSIINNAINCYDFNSLKDVVLNALQVKVKSLTLIPSTQLILNNDLDLKNLTFDNDFEFRIENIAGIEVEFDPFATYNTRTGKFYLFNSIFEIYNENIIIDSLEKCLSLFDSFFVSSFEYFDFVSLGENVKYKAELCPAIFMGTKLDTLEFFSLTQTNRPSFIDLSSSDVDLIASISNFKIFNSEIYLDDKLFSKIIFKYTKILSIENSNLVDIQDDLFSDFNELKSIELKLNNFKDFVEQSSMKWLNSLSSNKYQTKSKLYVHTYLAHSIQR